MELSFMAKEESGWRGRGRPPAPVPEKILDMLQRTDGTGEVGVVTVSGETDEHIAELMSFLRRGARQLGRRVRIQHDCYRDQVRFQLAPPPEDPREHTRRPVQPPARGHPYSSGDH